MEMNDFEALINANAAAEEHAAEIRRTRVGGLGGSDAALVYRIGTYGMAGLTATDLKRLAIMVGLLPRDDWNGNAYTNAGHKFEEYIADFFDRNPFCGWVDMTAYKREYYKEERLTKNINTFAHADFVTNDGGTVVECKFVNSKRNTDKVAATYAAQLQWYYLLGFDRVLLLHGWGTVEDEERGTTFGVNDFEIRTIDRDERTITVLRHGLEVLDRALTDGWKPVLPGNTTVNLCPDDVITAYTDLALAKKMKTQAAEMEEEARAVLMEYMQNCGVQQITDEACGTQVTFVKMKMSKRFSLDKFKKQLLDMAHKYTTISVDEVWEMIELSFENSTTAATVAYKECRTTDKTDKQ